MDAEFVLRKACCMDLQTTTHNFLPIPMTHRRKHLICIKFKFYQKLGRNIRLHIPILIHSYRQTFTGISEIKIQQNLGIYQKKKKPIVLRSTKRDGQMIAFLELQAAKNRQHY